MGGLCWTDGGQVDLVDSFKISPIERNSDFSSNILLHMCLRDSCYIQLPEHGEASRPPVCTKSAAAKRHRSHFGEMLVASTVTPKDYCVAVKVKCT